jgi:CHAD domain-containing protein
MEREMTTTAREVERKFDVNGSFRLPDLSGIGGVATVDSPAEHELSATYFDTADLRLLTHRVTLRRRTGGTDAGWHLKLPDADGERTEVRLPLGRTTTTPPKGLRGRVEVHLRGAAVAPVLRLATRRTVYKLRDADGRVLAEVADDQVTATDLATPEQPGAATVLAWREVEVELVEGQPRLLRTVGKALRAAGAAISGSGSKAARALADRRPAPVAGPDLAAGTAGALVLAELTDQVTELHYWDPLARADAPDAVHQMRVTVRRLRSTLATFRPVFDREVTEPVRAELGWLGDVLGGARDAEVIQEHLIGAARAEPPELLLGPVIGRLRTTLDGRRRAAMAQLRTELGGQRYFALLDALDRLVAEPPLSELAHDPGEDVLRRRVRSAWKRVDRAAGAVPDAAERDVALHELRKAAKRARYAAELAQGVFGGPAKRFAKQMKSVQTLLGEHQDTVVVREVLREVGVQAHLAGENGFTFGRLHALAQAAADQSERDLPEVWRAASDPEARRWLSADRG